MELRTFKNEDAEILLSWINNEEAFRKWSADRYKEYPAKPEDMIGMYERSKPGTQFSLTATDNNEVIGHMIVRFTDDAKKKARFGFVIVDSSKRGKGYGKKMLQLAVDHTFNVLKAETITLGVFANNDSARYCYEAVGFKLIDCPEEYYEVLNEKWLCLEMEYNQ